MAEQNRTTLVRCDMCGGAEADGIDEHGQSLCPRCSGRARGEREGEARALDAMLGAAVAGALLEGLPAEQVREVIEREIAAGGH